MGLGADTAGMQTTAQLADTPVSSSSQAFLDQLAMPLRPVAGRTRLSQRMESEDRETWEMQGTREAVCFTPGKERFLVMRFTAFQEETSTGSTG